MPLDQHIIATDPSADVSSLATSASQAREVHFMDFWSSVQAVVTVTAAAQDLSLPSVTVAGIPAGATLLRAVGMVKFRAVEDTSTSANKIDDNGGGNTPAIQVKDDGGCDWTDVITVVDSTVAVAASGKEGGDIWLGAIDVKAEVSGNDTYDFQWDDAEADGGNLVFRDVQTGLRIYWTL